MEKIVEREVEQGIEEQVKLEKEMQARGSEIYFSQIKKSEMKGRISSNDYGQAIASTAIPKVAEAIEAFMVKGAHKAGKRHAAIKYLKMIDSNVAAYIALKTLLDSMIPEKLIQNTAIRIGSAIEVECKLTKYEKEDKKSYRNAAKKAKDFTTTYRKTRVLSHFMIINGIEWEAWKKTTKLHLGIALIDIVIKATGLFEMVTIKRGVILQMTPKCIAWIDRRKEKSALFSPSLMPCVIPPKPWTSPREGGYYTAYVPPLKLVKTRSNEYIEELTNQDMPTVYTAVNALQNTAFKINRPVFETMQAMWKANTTHGVMPEQDDEDIPLAPIMPEDRESWTEAQKQTLKEWKYIARQIQTKNHAQASKRLQISQTIHVAERYLDYEKIYFPYQLDFRGRIYAVPKFLNPQGNDPAKALLTFAEGKALETQEAVRWLAVQGANVWGEDKCSLDDRYKWVKENENMILEIAMHPLDVLDWTRADKPWQFLAFCFDWLGYKREGLAFKSCLPIAMDGTCNGLQIFSLILKDAVGGAAVGLVPMDKPADIYQTVADKTISKLEKLLTTEEDEERKKFTNEWLSFGITRAGCKRQVMVLPYGGTRNSCREYTEEYIRTRMEKHRGPGPIHPWGDKLLQPSRFLSEIIWQAMCETVIAARTAMDWLQAVARIVAKEGLPVTWTSPVGFPVLQAYHETEKLRVYTKLGDGVRLRLTLAKDTLKVDRRKQTNGISPNFVHSLDAAALMKTVETAKEKGIDNFAMIHDSYGTHAALAAKLARILREVFVSLFTQHDVLTDFKNAVIKVLDEADIEKLPPIPKQGTLDIEKVLESTYFFA